ncbi:MAG: response regulator transcription factor [Pedobacter sp.]|nr:MAG: response regulator transcription factor [Pedobacter sp.]
MNCLIIDDNEIARLTLAQLLSLDSSLKLIGECASAKDAFVKILDIQVDLLLLDIEMPEMSGIELAKSLGDKQPLIIFTTSKRDYAVEAFDLRVVDFVTKPILPARFLQSIDKAKKIFHQKDIATKEAQDEFIFIRDSNTVRRIRLNDILFLEAKGDYVQVAVQGKTYAIHSSLKAVEDKLPKHFFIRVHRSFIVNVSKIDTIEGGTLIIEGNFVPVSDSFRGSLNKRIQIL